jgi:hydroxymethylpyrimidine/phosphomethylpyrimidine kinase
MARYYATKCLLSVAGYDPSAGAGVLQDIKVFQRFGFHGAAVLTAMTTQNTQGVENVYFLSANLLEEQYRVLEEDILFTGIKVGMAGSRENLKTIGKILAAQKDIPRVIDPVFRSSSGTWLMEKEAVSEFLQEIRKRATVLTPNLEEAGLMAGARVRTIADMKEAARAIFDRTRVPTLVKGGHLEKEAVNLLYDGRTVYLFGKKRIAKEVHGTGCFFSASLLGFLAQGKTLEKACEHATELTHGAIKTAVRVGCGRFVFRRI